MDGPRGRCPGDHVAPPSGLVSIVVPAPSSTAATIRLVVAASLRRRPGPTPWMVDVTAVVIADRHGDARRAAHSHPTTRPPTTTRGPTATIRRSSAFPPLPIVRALVQSTGSRLAVVEVDRRVVDDLLEDGRVRPDRVEAGRRNWRYPAGCTTRHRSGHRYVPGRSEMDGCRPELPVTRSSGRQEAAGVEQRVLRVRARTVRPGQRGNCMRGQRIADRPPDGGQDIRRQHEDEREREETGDPRPVERP